MYKTAKSCVASDGQISDTFLSCWGKTRRKFISFIVFYIPWWPATFFYKMHTRGWLLWIKCPKMTRRIFIEIPETVCTTLRRWRCASCWIGRRFTEINRPNVKNYCDLWKLNIKVSKTKITIFLRGKTWNIPKFQFGETQLTSNRPI